LTFLSIWETTAAVADAAAALPSEVDVLVVGLGPVGATLALLLGRYGVRTLVVDKATEIFPQPRAIALDNEALRILQLAGLDEGAFATIAIPEVRLRSPWIGELARVNTAGVLDGHPKLVMFYQPELERVLRARVAAEPTVATALGVALTALDVDESGTRATLRDRDGVETTVAARFLVGADGASSSVRTLVGLGFDGRSYPEDWLIVDARNTVRPIDHTEFLCDPRRPTPHMPAPGGRERWEFMLQPGESREEMERPERVRALLAPWGAPEEMEIERTAVYRFHARIVTSFQKGPVFLAGDAAHVTPPFAGQGLCTGLRDAANLAWKLAWVVRRGAAPSILASYDTERRPHAKAMIDLAKMMGHLIAPKNAPVAIALHAALRTARMLPPLRSFFDDLKVKPQPRFGRGLFAPGRGRRRGALFPQGWVQHAGNGAGRWSDDALGGGFALVGLGVDPGRHLGGAADAWARAGGTCVQICHRGQRLHRDDAPHVWEDVSGAIVPQAAPVGWAFVVRPDRTVLHDGPAADAARLVRESLQLLGGPS
jgi:3-(3-hydroxy-phenyl)propionate hydroxylase